MEFHMAIKNMKLPIDTSKMPWTDEAVREEVLKAGT